MYIDVYRQIALKALSERLSKVEHPQVKSQRVKGDTAISIPVVPLPTTPLIPPVPVTTISMEAPPTTTSNTNS